MESAGTIFDLGGPVRGASWVQLIPGLDADDKPALYATMGQNAKPFFILQIDPQTGEFMQYCAGPKGALCQYPTTAIWGKSSQCLYVGSYYHAHLHRFCPKLGRLEDLGKIDPADKFPCRIDEAPDGRLWIGCCATASLTRFDPETGTFTRYGGMDAVDRYFYPLVGDDGTVAGLVKMAKPHVVVLDPESGEHRSVGPIMDTDSRSGTIDLIKGNDGKLYIVSSEGDFRIDGMEIVPVDSVPQARPAPNLPDGSTFRFRDGDSYNYRELEIRPPDGMARTFHLDWEGAGTDIFVLHQGPDGHIYGSSILPLHLFRYVIEAGEITDLGQCSLTDGEVYSMGNLDGLLYMCSYAGARLSVYDPTQSYRFGTDPEANPRDLGRMDDVSFRPGGMLAGPLGKIWTGSYPDYGMWGGPLAWYDPERREFGGCRHVLKDQSVCSLAWIKPLKLIAGGTSIDGGTGTLPRAACAAFFLWDPEKSEKVWNSNFELPIHAVVDLLVFREALAYAVVWLKAEGTSKCELMLIDFERRAIISRSGLPSDAFTFRSSLRSTPEGRIYASTRSAFYEVEAGTTNLNVLVTNGLSICVPGPVVGDAFYFATGHVLRALKIP